MKVNEKTIIKVLKNVGWVRDDCFVKWIMKLLKVNLLSKIGIKINKRIKTVNTQPMDCKCDMLAIIHFHNR